MPNEKKWGTIRWIISGVVLVALVIEGLVGYSLHPLALYLFVNDTPKPVSAVLINGDSPVLAGFIMKSHNVHFVLLPQDMHDGLLDESIQQTSSYFPGDNKSYNPSDYRLIVPALDLYIFKIVPVAHLPLAKMEGFAG